MSAEPFLRIGMLPAHHGDCLWTEYGVGNETYRVLIDGGTAGTYGSIKKKIENLPAGEKVFELIVLTHVDADHVEGLVRLFADKPLPFKVEEVWFNGWRQMERSHGLLGPLQGEFLSALLANRAQAAWKPESPPWFVPSEGLLPSRTLPGGMKLTLLSPNSKTLKKMAKAWKSALGKTSVAPGDLEEAWKTLAGRKKFLPKEGLLGASDELDEMLARQYPKDQSAPNGSSIAFLAEYGNKSALFLADAHPDVISESIKRLCLERGIERLVVDAVKVSHHGSRGNTNKALLDLIRSPSYLFSTNGDIFKHPDKECIALILKHGHPKRMYFNYDSEYTRPWLDLSAQERHGYKSVVRSDPEIFLEIPL